MAKKNMKKCSPSLSIKETQIKTPLRFHLTPVRIRKTNKTNVSKDARKRNPHTPLVGM
jgi:hypothetical protein